MVLSTFIKLNKGIFLGKYYHGEDRLWRRVFPMSRSFSLLWQIKEKIVLATFNYTT